ncbi:MAG: hypothetical protein KKF68_03595 [Nanoarchaeota archaeon]|nr:hypothetical protein [Nanoarchaeota archaeon]
MALLKQKKVVKLNIKRSKPGVKGEGNYYRVLLRPKTEFVSFRNHDIGRKGHLQRLAGKRRSGSWDTHAWLISKKDAHVVNGALIGDSPSTKKLLSQLQTKPKKVRGDIFKAKDRKNIPEKSKPTPAMKRAQKTNIKKALAVRLKRG